MCTSVAMDTDTSDATLSDLQRCEIEGSDSGKFENSSFMHQQPLQLLICFLTFDMCVRVRACVRVWRYLDQLCHAHTNPCLNYETPSATTRYFFY